MESQRERHEPTCMVAHDLLNKFAVIIGQCELLNEMMEPGTPSAERLARIRKIAESAVKELNEHQRKADVEARKGG